MKFANYSKELKKLTKKMGYQIQLVIKPNVLYDKFKANG